MKGEDSVLTWLCCQVPARTWWTLSFFFLLNNCSSKKKNRRCSMKMYKYIEWTFIFRHSAVIFWKKNDKMYVLSYWIGSSGDALFSFTWQIWKDVVQRSRWEGWAEGEDHTLAAYPRRQVMETGRRPRSSSGISLDVSKVKVSFHFCVKNHHLGHSPALFLEGFPPGFRPLRLHGDGG